MRKLNTIVVAAALGAWPVAGFCGAAVAGAPVDPDAGTRYLADGAASLEQTFHGNLVKQGTGTNTLSLADVHTANGRIVVADGMLNVTGAAASNAPEKPWSILSNAVVWLDASLTQTIDFVEGSAVNVSQWRDVRETGDGTTAHPYVYRRAVAITNLGHSATYAPDPNGWFPTYSPAANGENAYVDFGQYSSGRMVRFRNASNGQWDVNPLRHAFVVIGTHDGHYGFIFDPGPNSVVYVPNNYWSLVNCQLYNFIQSSGGWTTLIAGVFRVDGVAVDPLNTKPNGGYQLLDLKTGRSGWVVKGLFSHNLISNDTDGYRQGGGRLCEIILFSRTLEEPERLRVEAYLRHKWCGAKVSAPTYALGANGGLSFSGGVLDMSDPLALTVTGGATYSATTAGVECASAASSSLVKTGDGEFVVGKIASGLTNVSVNAGTLRLRQGVDSPVSVPTNLCGYIEDPSFEAFSDRTVGDLGLGLSSSSEHGWKSHGSYENGTIAKWKSAGGYFNVAGMPYPDGNYAGVLHIRGGLQTTVTLPSDGVYRLSYWLAIRPGNNCNYRGHEHRVLIDGIPVAEVKAWDPSYNWHLCTFRLPWLSAGEHTLVLASDLNNSKEASMRTVDFNVTDSIMKNAQDSVITGNIVGMVDDFHVDWIEPGEGEVAVSNASFEVTSFSARGYEMFPSDLVGWEYVSTNASNQIFTEQTWNGQFKLHPASDGCRILNIVNLAQIGQDVTFPDRGTYTLTCAAASVQGDGGVTTPGSLLFTLGGTTIGTLQPNAVMKTYSFSFDVPEDNYTAKLVIAGQVEHSIVSIDDVRISGRNPAVVAANTFTSDGWEKTEEPSDIQDGSGKVDWLPIAYLSDVSWGTVVYGNDANRVGIRNRASIWRTVAFPEAGTYRLSVASIGRFYRYNNLHLSDPGILARYSGNEFDAWVAKGGVTNVIGRFGVDDRERFVTHRFVFELPEGGDWKVGFSGLKQSEHKVQGSNSYYSNGGVLDGLVIEKVTAGAVPQIPASVEINVADGAKLALDYIGTNTAYTVRYAGRSVTGDINAETCPDFVTGVGSLFVQPKGTMILFR
jgi:hypothetical protein